MKLISLNIWDARIFDPLIGFFKSNQDADIFCLQEVFNGPEARFFRDGKRLNGFDEIAKALPGHEGFFVNTETLDDVPEQQTWAPYGLAIFLRKDIKILSHHHDVIFGPGKFSNRDPKTHKRVIQTVRISHEGKPLAISHVHGLWNGQGKTDTPERISQSENIKRHISGFDHPLILAGDFNLLPETQSLAVVSKGMRNLIEENKITSTRSKLYAKHEKPVLFADYIFTTPEVLVKDFKVLPDVVSDHLPLMLDFA